jgi:hypothetical protein
MLKIMKNKKESNINLQLKILFTTHPPSSIIPHNLTILYFLDLKLKKN